MQFNFQDTNIVKYLIHQKICALKDSRDICTINIPDISGPDKITVLSKFPTSKCRNDS